MLILNRYYGCNSCENLEMTRAYLGARTDGGGGDGFISRSRRLFYNILSRERSYTKNNNNSSSSSSSAHAWRGNDGKKKNKYLGGLNFFARHTHYNLRSRRVRRRRGGFDSFPPSSTPPFFKTVRTKRHRSTSHIAHGVSSPPLPPTKSTIYASATIYDDGRYHYVILVQRTYVTLSVLFDYNYYLHSIL